MPGVYRPYSLTDVLGTLTDQSAQQQDTTVTGLGDFAETAELFTLSEHVTGTVTTNPTWGGGTWGTVTWS